MDPGRPTWLTARSRVSYGMLNSHPLGRAAWADLRVATRSNLDRKRGQMIAKSQLVIVAVIATTVYTTNAYTKDGESRLNTAAFNQCIAHTDVDVEMHDCINTELTIQDNTLNDTYKTVMARASSARKLELRDAERAWISRTKKKCETYASQFGSEAGTELDGCYLAETESRTLYLRSLSPSGR